MLKTCQFDQVPWSNNFLCILLSGSRSSPHLIWKTSHAPNCRAYIFSIHPREHMRTLALAIYQMITFSCPIFCCCCVCKSYTDWCLRVLECSSLFVACTTPKWLLRCMLFGQLVSFLNATGSLNFFIAFFKISRPKIVVLPNINNQVEALQQIFREIDRENDNEVNFEVRNAGVVFWYVHFIQILAEGPKALSKCRVQTCLFSGHLRGHSSVSRAGGKYDNRTSTMPRIFMNFPRCFYGPKQHDSTSHPVWQDVRNAMSSGELASFMESLGISTDDVRTGRFTWKVANIPWIQAVHKPWSKLLCLLWEDCPLSRYPSSSPWFALSFPNSEKDHTFPNSFWALFCGRLLCKQQRGHFSCSWTRNTKD